MKRSFFLIAMMFYNLPFFSQGETCETAQAITVGIHTATGPSFGDGAMNPCGLGGGISNANWYSYTPEFDQQVIISSCLGGVDTRLTVLIGICSDLDCITANDDFCEMEEDGDTWASYVEFNALEGVIYYIQWDDRWETDGFEWELSTGDLIPPPINNICSSATSLIVNEECVFNETATNSYATSSNIDPGCASYNGNEVWFSFNAPISGLVTIHSAAAGGIEDTGMALYSGNCDELELIDCNDDTEESLFAQINAINLIEGEEYFIAVWSWNNEESGEFGICAYETPVIDCSLYSGPYDNFNTTFGGAPVALEIPFCPTFQLTNFEVWANQLYLANNFHEGEVYTFSICDGPNAGNWPAEITILDSELNIIAGPEEYCAITWICPIDGDYYIGINEAGICGSESENLAVSNGFASLTCQGNYVEIADNINENDINTSQVTIYPLPVADILTIKTKGLQNDISVTIFTIEGQIVKNANLRIKNHKAILSISSLPPGIYTIKITDNIKIFTKKIIIR